MQKGGHNPGNENNSKLSRKRLCASIGLENSCWFVGPIEPVGFKWFMSNRGCEYFQLYLWIMKDLCWTQDWYYMGNFFGGLATCWVAGMVVNAARQRNVYEVAVCIGSFLWLLANWCWMSGELHDHKYPSEALQYRRKTIESGHIMIVDVSWFLFYYVVIRGLYLCSPSLSSLHNYDDTGKTKAVGSVTVSWRDYEHFHVFIWLLKDMAWNSANKITWPFFSLPTLVVACDFVRNSFFNKKMFIEHMHIVAQLLWVCANLTWAYGEIYVPQFDKPFPLLSDAAEARRTCRWYSAWLLVAAAGVVGVLYAIWIPATLLGRIALDEKHAADTASVVSSSSSSNCSDESPLYSPQMSFNGYSAVAEDDAFDELEAGRGTGQSNAALSRRLTSIELPHWISRITVDLTKAGNAGDDQRFEPSAVFGSPQGEIFVNSSDRHRSVDDNNNTYQAVPCDQASNIMPDEERKQSLPAPPVDVYIPV